MLVRVHHLMRSSRQIMRSVYAPGAEAHPRDGASREPAAELDYRLWCMLQIMRTSRNPPSTWAVPSATKPCFR